MWRDCLPVSASLGVFLHSIHIYDPPLARVCHVLFEVFSFHGHKTIFVGAKNNFERASFQVSLFKTITNVGIKRVIAFQTNKGEGVLVSTSLAKMR